MGKDPADPEFIQIGFNHRSAGQAMAQHLLDCGHRDLVYVDSGVKEDFRAHERGVGFTLTAERAAATVRTIQLGGGISTLAAPRYAIGQNAGLKILKELDFKHAGNGIPSTLKPTLIVRNTTRLPAPTPG